MKYFPHLSNASDDEDMIEVLEVQGPVGYGIYWIITEIVARNLKSPKDVPSVTMLRATWARKCFVRPNLFTKTVSILSGLGKIVVEDDGDYVTVKHPKLLKYLDEYTKKVGSKSGQSPDGVPSGVGTMSGTIEENRIEEKKRKKMTPPTSTVEAVESSSEIENPKARAEAMKTIKNAIAQLPGPSSQQQIPKAHDSGNGKIPKAEGPEAFDVLNDLASLDIPGIDLDPIVDAVVAFRKGTHNEYAVASALDSAGVKGIDRSRIYSKIKAIA